MNYIACNFICQCLHMDEAARICIFGKNISIFMKRICFSLHIFIRRKSQSDRVPVLTGSFYGMRHNDKST